MFSGEWTLVFNTWSVAMRTSYSRLQENPGTILSLERLEDRRLLAAGYFERLDALSGDDLLVIASVEADANDMDDHDFKGDIVFDEDFANVEVDVAVSAPPFDFGSVEANANVSVNAPIGFAHQKAGGELSFTAKSTVSTVGDLKLGDILTSATLGPSYLNSNFEYHDLTPGSTDIFNGWISIFGGGESEFIIENPNSSSFSAGFLSKGRLHISVTKANPILMTFEELVDLTFTYEHGESFSDSNPDGNQFIEGSLTGFVVGYGQIDLSTTRTNLPYFTSLVVGDIISYKIESALPPLPAAEHYLSSNHMGSGDLDASVEAEASSRLAVWLFGEAVLEEEFFPGAMFEIPNVPVDFILVTTEDDENDGDYSFGDLSLREAILLAGDANHPGEDVILFAPWVNEIVLGNQLTIGAGNNVHIAGPGKELLTIDGNNSTRIFSIASGTDVTISGLTISGGSLSGTNSGAAISSQGDLFLKDLVITGNTTTYSLGATVHQSGGSLDVLRTEISNNTSNSTGIRVENAASLTIIDSTIAQNTSSYFGGIRVQNANAEIINSTISGNTGSAAGGISFSVDSGSYSATVINSTITNNVANTNRGGVGGISRIAIGSGSLSVVLHNSIIAGNVAYNSPADVVGAFGSTSSHNLIGWIDGSTGLNAVTSLFGGSSYGGTLSAGLDALAYNGGPTRTHALQSTSPAIDKGNDFLAPDFDQRGEGRSVDLPPSNGPGGSSDIGAFELQAVPLMALAAEEEWYDFGFTSPLFLSAKTESRIDKQSYLYRTPWELSVDSIETKTPLLTFSNSDRVDAAIAGFGLFKTRFDEQGVSQSTDLKSLEEIFADF
jgi:hypothetical protein